MERDSVRPCAGSPPFSFTPTRNLNHEGDSCPLVLNSQSKVSPKFPEVRMKELSPSLRRSEPVASFLLAPVIWIADYEELIDGRWHRFMTTHPRKIRHSSCEGNVPVDQLAS